MNDQIQCVGRVGLPCATLRHCTHRRTQMYNEEEDRYVISGHEGDKEFQLAFWKKVLLSLCDSG